MSTAKNNGLNKATKPPSKKYENTTIRPRALARVKAVLPFLPDENITDFLSTAADERTKPLIKEHKIKLPPDAEFIGSE